MDQRKATEYLGGNVMVQLKRMVQKMSRHMSAYNNGSIMGRTVYKTKKLDTPRGNISIFGKKVYKNTGKKTEVLCGE